jgi:hypothetical protein
LNAQRFLRFMGARRAGDFFLVSTNHEHLIPPVRADIPGRNRARNADDHCTEHRGPEPGNHEIIEHRRDQPEHGSIQYEQEQTERNDGQWQGQQKGNRSNESVDETEQDRCKNEVTCSCYLHSWNQRRSHIQTEHRYQSAEDDSLHALIMLPRLTLC